MVEFIRPTFLPLLVGREPLPEVGRPVFKIPEIVEQLPEDTKVTTPTPSPTISSVPDLISRPPLLQTLAPTPAEITLQQSLLPEFRFADPRDTRQALIVVRQLEPKRLEALAEPTIQPVEEPRRTGIIETFITAPETRVATPTIGERARQFFGEDISIPLFAGVPGGEVSLRQIREGLRGVTGRAAFPIRVGAELIPVTRGEAAIFTGITGAAILSPPIIATGISLGVGALGVRTAFDPGLTIEQRTAGGLVGVLGGVGAAAGTVPFIRGIGARPARVSPEGFRTIPGLTEAGEIALIEPGKGARLSIDLPPTSPLVRGGFGRIPGGEQRFIGGEQFLATSQRGFFRPGVDIPITREFFVTPQEPLLRIPETRISRLGLQDPFKIPQAVDIGFGLPPRPQIGIVRGEVARTQRRGAFELGTGTELEAFRTTGVITDVRQIGRARISREGVDIFEFRVGRGRRGRPSRTRDFVSTEPTGRISGETLLGTLGLRTTRGISIPTTGLVSPLISLPTLPLISPLVSPRISPGISPFISPRITPRISPPTTTGITLPFFSPIFPTPRIIRRPRRVKAKVKKKRKGERARVRIAPSFTGIVLEIERAAEISPTFGVLPGQIRGLRTGF